MAYKVSSEIISLFKSCYRQIAKIRVSGIEGLDEINESDILQGGLTIDRYCFSSNSLEIGTAIASEATIELKNADGRFDKYTFDGAKFTIRVGIKKWDAKAWEKATIHYIPLGVFTVDEKTKNKSSITLNALDNMVKFDKEYDTELVFPATLSEIAEDACSKCGVLLKTTVFDRVPDGAKLAGFLNGLDPEFVAVLGEIEVKTALSACDMVDGVTYDITHDKVWLQSMTEIFGGNNNGIAEGSQMAYWGGAADADRIKYEGTIARYWLLRSPYPAVVNYVCIVSPSGCLTGTDGGDRCGAVPACCII